MKKGLRPGVRPEVAVLDGNEHRPDEKGIATCLFRQGSNGPRRNEHRPDEKGIATVSSRWIGYRGGTNTDLMKKGLRLPPYLQDGLSNMNEHRPDEKGIATSTSS